MIKNKIVVDGRGSTFGRLASFVSKELLKGDFVEILNCEEIIFSGNKDFIVNRIKSKRNMGKGSSLKGPKYIRQEEKLIKRMIRGMLPRDKPKGREALKRLKCHVGSGNLKKEDLEKVISLKHKKPREYSTTKEIVRSLR